MLYLRLSTTSESQPHSEKSIGRFHLTFYAKLPTSSLAGVSGSFAFFFPIFLAASQQFSRQVNSFLLSRKKFQILLQKHRHFPTKTAGCYSNWTPLGSVSRSKSWKRGSLQALRNQNTNWFIKMVYVSGSKWNFGNRKSLDYALYPNILSFLSSGNVLENRSIWRLSIFSDVFWGIINFVILL